jgi:hypothetical protein
MALLSTSSFDRSNIPQSTLTVGGWNLPSYGSNIRFNFLRESAQMGGYSTYYTSSIYPSSSMPVSTNTLPMASLHLSSGISYRGSQFYSTGYPLHRIPSSGGNIYLHLNNSCHAFFSSKTSTLVMMPLQNSMDQLGGGYHPTRKGQGVDQNPSCHAMSQNQSFSGPWS